MRSPFHSLAAAAVLLAVLSSPADAQSYPARPVHVPVLQAVVASFA